MTYRISEGVYFDKFGKRFLIYWFDRSITEVDKEIWDLGFSYSKTNRLKVDVKLMRIIRFCYNKI